MQRAPEYLSRHCDSISSWENEFFFVMFNSLENGFYNSNYCVISRVIETVCIRVNEEIPIERFPYHKQYLKIVYPMSLTRIPSNIISEVKISDFC